MVVAACVALACPAVAAAASKTVYAGGPVAFQNQIGKKYGATVDNYLVNRVTVNVGDTVVWNGKALASGFHTVDFPGKATGPQALFLTGATVTGVNDAAGNPFWFNGHVPSVGFNPALFASSKGGKYNGSARLDSGLPIGKRPDFKLKFTKAGTYKYFCDVHPGMMGIVVVKPKGKAVPTAKDDAKTLKKAEAAYVTGAKKLDKTAPSGANVSVGAAGANGLEVLAMFPGSLSVKAGTTVTFSMAKGTREVHTATFGPMGKGSFLETLSNSFAGPAPAPAAVYPSDPPGTITLTPTSHGNGFANVGVMDQVSASPQPSSGKITFSTPGTYQFMCLIHPFMHGTIKVT